MLKRPIPIVVICLVLFASPLYYYVDTARFIHARPFDVVGILRATSYLKLAAAVLGPIVGALVFSMRPAGWYAIVAYCLLAAASNAYLYATHRMALDVAAIFAPLSLAAMGYFAQREIRSPFFNPRLRWWVSDRVRFAMPVEIAGVGSGTTADISPTGVFVAIDAAVPSEVLELTLQFPSGAVPAKARLVWTSDGSARARGVGLQFDDASAHTLEPLVTTLDHRADQRLDFALQVEIENHGLIHCTTFDLSEGGCFLATDKTFALGELLVLKVHLPSEPVAVEGRVVWLSDGTRRPRGAGVRFTKTSSSLVAKLREIRER